MLREFWHGFLDEKSNRLVMPRALRDSERQRQRQWHKKSETESKLRNCGALEPGSPLAFELGFALLYYFFLFGFFFFVYPRNFRRCISTHSTVPAIYLVFSRRLRCVFHLLSFDSFCSNSIAIGNDKKNERLRVEITVDYNVGKLAKRAKKIKVNTELSRIRWQKPAAYWKKPDFSYKWTKMKKKRNWTIV